MQAKHHYLRVLMSTLVCSVLLATIAGITPLTRNKMANAALMDQIFKAHRIQVPPVFIRYNPVVMRHGGSVSPAADPVSFACQSNSNPQSSLCYGPYQMRQAYHVNDLLEQGITGKGSAITIIDAYGSPSIRQDLEAFDAIWGLPNPQLNVITPYGDNGSDSSWIAETSLDVEWAHVMAPDATINLVVARDNYDSTIFRVLAYAVRHNLGDVISLSFGENENCVDSSLRLAAHRLFQEATSKGMTLLAASGYFGSAQLACYNNAFEKAVSFPADDPLVTAVGGTTLTADPETGQYIHEAVWNESSAFNRASGGGYSKIYRVPTFQRGLLSKAGGRGVPDIALNASIDRGVIVLDSPRATAQPTIDIMGGTSAAVPELAGLLADGVQMAHRRLGLVNPALYRLGISSDYYQLMNDITSGNNMLLSSGFRGYWASPGWNAATGWGSPRDAGLFLQALIAADISMTRGPTHRFVSPTSETFSNVSNSSKLFRPER